VAAHALAFSAPAVPLASWWWPRRPARVPRAWAAALLACVGAALFGVTALVLKAGAPGWDESLFRVLNDVPAALASVLTPLSHLFRPAGIVIVMLLALGVLVRHHAEQGAAGRDAVAQPPGTPSR